MKWLKHLIFGKSDKELLQEVDSLINAMEGIIICNELNKGYAYHLLSQAENLTSQIERREFSYAHVSRLSSATNKLMEKYEFYKTIR